MSQVSGEEYFTKLNYTLANEDTSYEVSLLKRLKPQSIFSVCGSGGRCMPLLVAAPKVLLCSDLVQEQLWLAELRFALLRSVSREDFLKFFGYPPFEKISSEIRKSIFNEIQLSSGAEQFFKTLFEQNSWESLLYLGKWEKTFQKIGFISQKILGNASRRIFEFTDIEEQKDWISKHFPKWRWKALLSLIGNASFFNALLYKGHFVKKNISETYLDFYSGAYKRIFAQTLLRENYFAQLSLLGKIQYPEGAPVEVRADVFEASKKAVEQTQVIYQKEDMVSFLSSGKLKFDFLSLSDVPSYFQGSLEQSFMQDIKTSLNPGAHVVLRSYLRIPERMNLKGYSECTSEYIEFANIEKTQMYRIQVFRFEG